MKCKFKVGDIITGNSSKPYSFTNNKSICEVTRTFKKRSLSGYRAVLYDDMDVRIIYTPNKEEINAEYPVHSGFFYKLCTKKELTKKKLKELKLLIQVTHKII